MFEKVAELYDLYRPGYPAQLFKDIIEKTSLQPGGLVLEIGAGTGKATDEFVKYNCSVQCIDASHSMIEKLRSKFRNVPTVRAVVSSFEEWSPEGKTFDIVAAAQAFHWLPPEISYPKSASILKEGGHIALFWNTDKPQELEIEKKISALYQLRVPKLVAAKRPIGKAFIDRQTNEILASELFTDVCVKTYDWSQVYSYADYINLLNSYTDHIALSDLVRRRLYDGIHSIFQQFNDAYEKRYETILFLARPYPKIVYF
jgi:ubiquinone/menaquinone biosynthesis C-methylase UbiE